MLQVPLATHHMGSERSIRFGLPKFSETIQCVRLTAFSSTQRKLGLVSLDVRPNLYILFYTIEMTTLFSFYVLVPTRRADHTSSLIWIDGYSPMQIRRRETGSQLAGFQWAVAPRKILILGRVHNAKVPVPGLEQDAFTMQKCLCLDSNPCPQLTLYVEHFPILMSCPGKRLLGVQHQSCFLGSLFLRNLNFQPSYSVTFIRTYCIPGEMKTAKLVVVPVLHILLGYPGVVLVKTT